MALLDNPDKEYIDKIPPNLKSRIGYCFCKAHENDPEIMVPYTRALISALHTAMIICNNTKYDELIIWHTKNSTDALAQLATGNWGAAMTTCYAIMDDVDFIVEMGYGNVEGGSYSFPTIANVKEVKK